MSRYHKMLLSVPNGVDVKFEEDSSVFLVKGPKGELSFTLVPHVLIKKESGGLRVVLRDESSRLTQFVGLTFRMIQNMFLGVTSGFEKVLEFNGVGYRMAVKGEILNMQLGYSHDINYPIPKGVELEVKDQKLTVKGVDKELVGRVADEIKRYRPVEPYKGKGIRYAGQRVIRKAGKSSKK